MHGFVVSGRRSPSTKPLIVKEEKTETIVSIDGSDIEIVAEPECPSIRMMLMRVVRELATNHLLARGALLLHAAAFVLDENGVLILGPSDSGKTTLPRGARPGCDVRRERSRLRPRRHGGPRCTHDRQPSRRNCRILSPVRGTARVERVQASKDDRGVRAAALSRARQGAPPDSATTHAPPGGEQRGDDTTRSTNVSVDHSSCAQNANRAAFRGNGGRSLVENAVRTARFEKSCGSF